MPDEAPVTRFRDNWGMPVLFLVLIGTTILAFAYSYGTRRQIRELEASNRAVSASLNQIESQLRAVSERLQDRAVALREAQVQDAAPVRPAKARPASAPAATPDTRLTRLQTQVARQEKELASTRADLSKTRDELQTRLDSTREELSGSVSRTRDELSGSIARTHEELVALQKRGERNYFEFEIDKSKNFRRVGPVGVSLRKANTKRQSYDLALVVDDNQLQKKGINLYEPVWINLEDRPDPVELVVNRITKDRIRGYVSEPKFKKSDLDQTASASPAPGVQ
jgi:hypothetical protein